MTTPPFELYRLNRDLTRGQLIDELSRMPGRVRDAIASASPEQLERKHDGWSALDTCKHLRDVIKVYGLRFKYIALEDDPFLPNYDEDRWVAQSPDTAADVESLIAEMSGDRAETVRLLRSLPDAAWARTGRHEVLGPVTLDPYVRHELAHEEGHVAQIEEALRAAR
jgi:uncharacterized damage-inducible protein DinB